MVLEKKERKKKLLEIKGFSFIINFLLVSELIKRKLVKRDYITFLDYGR